MGCLHSLGTYSSRQSCLDNGVSHGAWEVSFRLTRVTLVGIDLEVTLGEVEVGLGNDLVESELAAAHELEKESVKALGWQEVWCSPCRHRSGRERASHLESLQSTQ
jgi:hypothetical protein